MRPTTQQHQVVLAVDEAVNNIRPLPWYTKQISVTNTETDFPVHECVLTVRMGKRVTEGVRSMVTKSTILAKVKKVTVVTRANMEPW